jgi:raffinose/stachyose/melibiose transport system substrate-binding protein
MSNTSAQVRKREPRSRLRSRLAIVAGLTIPALALAACSSSGGTTTPSTSTSASSSAAAEPVTLWVQSGDGGSDALLKGYAALNTAFEAAHPGVTVKFTVKNFNDLVNTLKLQLSGSNVPDVTQVNQGYGSLGQLVTDQLVKPLDDSSAKYNWSARQSEALLNLDGAFSPDGKSMGSGSLYGVAATGAWVGLFMNLDNAKKLGITAPPATLADLEADLAKAKDGGVTPLVYGTSDGGTPIWLIANLIMSQGSPQLLTDIVNGTSATLPPEVLGAAQTLKKWADDGYFSKGSAAFSGNDAVGKFAKGDGLFTLNGSWNVFTADNPAGFTLVPFPTGTAGTTASIATGDLPWSIPAKAAHPDLAAEYINFITDPANNATWVANGQVPASVSGTETQLVADNKITGVSADAITKWSSLAKDGTTLPFPDWATPTWYDTISKSAQSLEAGQITPEEFVKALQDDYGAFTTKRMGG